jgi:glycosyltransferase involved in cell wall biosynthesis
MLDLLLSEPNTAYASDAPTLSVIVPMFNEGDNVDAFFTRLLPVLDRLSDPVEVIVVNDGSRDDTLERVKAWQQREPRVKVIDLSRNFGQMAAITAGLRHATGRCVVPIDADLQNPPEMIPELLGHWRQGYEIVTPIRKRPDDEPALRTILSKAFYRLFSRICGIKLIDGASEFRLLDRRVVDTLNEMPEQARFMKGMFVWIGFRHLSIPYNVAPRHAGASKYSVWKLWSLALRGITSFTTWPLRVWSYVGFLLAAVSLGYSAYYLLLTVFFPHVAGEPGFPSLIVSITFLGGIQLLCLGIIGEYIGNIYEEVKRRPLFIVRQRIGFE